MTLFKINDVFYIRHNNRRISLSTTDETLANSIFTNIATQFYLQKLELIPQSYGTEKVLQSLRLDVLFEEYIKAIELQDVSKDTIRFKKSTFKLLRQCNILTTNDINQKNINLFIEKIQKYSVDTQRKYLTDLMAFFNNCVKKGYLSKDLIERLDVPKTRSKARTIIIPESDLKIIFDYTLAKDKDFYYYLLTLFNTFSRPNEVTGLRLSAFDLKNRNVKIYQNKTKKEKIVYLKKDYCNEISSFIETKTDYLFNGYDRSKEFYSNKFKSLKKVLQLNKNFTLYTFRHTSITYLMNKTNDVEFVAKQAGANPEVIMKHYINRSNQHYLDIIDKNV